MSAVALTTTLEVPRDHPAFEGHFPGHPIVPGVVLLAEALAALQSATATAASDWRVESAKFTSPVGPGARLALALREERPGRVRFEIRAGERAIASGTFAAREPARAAS
jgi:3-hydroxymyristoyl/3-hydroxydecanoyl-(acyl carrier protein) dehydratase